MENTMIQQVMTEPGKITFRRIPVPEVQEGQVLVKIKRIGICGSDIHVYYGEHATTSYPVTQGHEVSGKVVQLGGGAAAETKTYTYVVEGRQVLNETANFPEEGGKVFDSTSSAYLGTVKSCWTEPFREVNFNRTTNKYEMLPVPGYCNIYVEIEGSGTETDQDITVEGNVVKVGKEQNVKGKGYAFKGYIVEVRDGE